MNGPTLPNVPTLPSDNLYKFIAFTGLVLIVLGTLLIWSEANRSQELLRQLQQEVEMIRAKREATVVVSTTSKALNEQLSVLRELSVDLAKLVAGEKELAFILEWKTTHLVMYAASLVVGTILCAVGFSLWYSRVQKYQDRILRNEAYRQDISLRGIGEDTGRRS